MPEHGQEDRAPCPHFPLCVGCPLIRMPYADQLARKQAELRASIDAYPRLRALELDPPCASPRPLGYRNHAKLVFRSRTRGGRREVVLGVYRPGTHSVLPADGCIIHTPEIRPILRSLRREVEALGIPIFDERVRRGVLRYALARSSSAAREVHLTLVVARREVPQLDVLSARLRRAHPALGALFVCVNPTTGNRLLSDDVRRVFGRPALVERFGGHELESGPTAFLQANVGVASRIYASVVRWLDPAPGESVLDLYCGVGGVALAVAERARRVVGIEASEAAIACAHANRRRAGRTNVRFLAGRAEDAIGLARQAGIERVDLAVVNPPRAGLGLEVREALVRLAPRRLAYVSCNPQTLARDLDWLAGRGHATRRLRAFDMLPQTPHVEALALVEAETGVAPARAVKTASERGTPGTSGS
ncbi:MAG TPA: 23S rRNA (uracil(1939)-C(5))-methyltransferase RlmD [Candidatus Bathyarchaeia archaeon]|nr:23S rRNA (uracil(1939)-C(5))-methyltransferase RlmD [Candidatus Bathyarchaeia archaeon]